MRPASRTPATLLLLVLALEVLLLPPPCVASDSSSEGRSLETQLRAAEGVQLGHGRRLHSEEPEGFDVDKRTRLQWEDLIKVRASRHEGRTIPHHWSCSGLTHLSRCTKRRFPARSLSLHACSASTTTMQICPNRTYSSCDGIDRSRWTEAGETQFSPLEFRGLGKWSTFKMTTYDQHGDRRLRGGDSWFLFLRDKHQKLKVWTRARRRERS